MLTEAVSGQNLSIVKESLFSFITSHLPDADLSAIDDIILSYVYSTLEGGSDDFYSQLNDVVADFADMMSAYVADFNKIDSSLVCDWMIGVIEGLEERSAAARAARENQEEKAKDAIEIEIPNADKKDQKNKKGSRGSRSSSNSTSEDEKEGCEKEKLVAVFYEDENHYRKCKQLTDMFPGTNPMEIKHCISIGFGDVTVAADALLHRRDSGQAIECSAWQVAAKAETVDDDEIKHRIIARYSYVDRESEAKEHKPAPPKIEPKKMVRYRDNKIVSLKGERYTEVSKTGEEEGVKKGNKKNHP